MTLRMIDEASYQGRTWDTGALKAAGIQVVAVKATEGTTYANPDYAWQVTQAENAGCAVMHYHVARYTDSQAEAEWFVHHSGMLAGDLVMLDNEAQYIEALGPAAAAAWVSAFIKEVKRLTRAPSVVIYTSADPVTRGFFQGIAGKEPLFLAWPGANPARPPAPPGGWLLSFLQYTTRTSAGVSTDVDCAYFGTLAQLRKLAIPAPVVPVPPPAGPTREVASGTDSIAELAKRYARKPSDIILATAFERLTGHMLAKPPIWGWMEAEYLDAGDWTAPLPAGSVWWVP